MTSCEYLTGNLTFSIFDILSVSKDRWINEKWNQITPIAHPSMGTLATSTATVTKNPEVPA
jgi:hypothetical protein